MTHELWVLSAIFGTQVVLIAMAGWRHTTLSEIASAIRAQRSTLDTIKFKLNDIHSTLLLDR
jgi:hypothetical protein